MERKCNLNSKGLIGFEVAAKKGAFSASFLFYFCSNVNSEQNQLRIPNVRENIHCDVLDTRDNECKQSTDRLNTNNNNKILAALGRMQRIIFACVTVDFPVSQ